MTVPVLRLKKGHERRVRGGNCWVYSNEIDTAATPFAALPAGEPVTLADAAGRELGSGYVNPHSLIAVRIVSRDRAHPLCASLFVHRLKVALGLRERLYRGRCYRLLHAESDGLPGLIVDRYGDYLVVQITTAGMERWREAIVDALLKVVRPAGILWRNDVAIREQEGLERYVAVAAGEVPDELELVEDGVRFRVAARDGQKTGWFYDQAASRRTMTGFVDAGARVLDLCSYVGGWGVRAAVAGAGDVLCVDASAAALERVHANAALNGVGERVATLQGDVFDALRELHEERQRFDLVLLDPPAFIKRKKDLKEGIAAYRRLNQLALRVGTKDSILVSSSCSYHMSGDELLAQIAGAARQLERSLQWLASGRQGPDHPVHPAMPETAYLKAHVLRILPRF